MTVHRKIHREREFGEDRELPPAPSVQIEKPVEELAVRTQENVIRVLEV